MELGERIRMMRLAGGQSEQDLAKSLGVTPEDIKDWEAGKKEPNISQGNALCTYFSISFAFLSSGNEYNYKDQDMTKKMAKYQAEEKKMKIAETNITKVIAACKSRLDELGINGDNKDVLPFLDLDSGDGINTNCFAADSKGRVQLVYERVYTKRRSDIIVKVFPDKADVNDATKVNDWDLFTKVVNKLASDKKKNSYDLSKALDQINRDCNFFYEAVVYLIEHGAYVTTDYGYEEGEFGPMRYEQSTSIFLTSFVYRMAKDKVAEKQAKSPKEKKAEAKKAELEMKKASEADEKKEAKKADKAEEEADDDLEVVER